jgi:hemolysin-activating ACP:hemolysin acyltransferase
MDEIRVFQPRDPRAALGMAVSYLMTDPVFARLPFGQWSRVLTGQINRGHFLFAIEGTKVVGFAGWALTTKDKAEGWLKENRELTFADSRDGEIVLINAWKASTSNAHRFLVDALRHVIRDKEMVYARRFYRDGRVRWVRLAINAVVANHVARRKGALTLG